MSCPYFKESYFAVCVAPHAIHIPTIDEMERLCFRSCYRTCPHIARMETLRMEKPSVQAGSVNE